MGLNLNDLPPKIREQVLAQAKAKGIAIPKSARPKPAKSRAGTGTGEACEGVCKCGEEFGTAAAWERHATGAGPEHSRWEMRY